MYIVALFVIAFCLLLIAKRNLKLAYISLAALFILAASFYFISSPSRGEHISLEKNQFKQSILLKNPKHARGYANGWVLSALLENTHETQILSAILLSSKLQACVQNSQSTKPSCENIEEENWVEHRLLPQQNKAIQVNLGVRSKSNEQGELTWSHEIIRVK